MQTTKEQLKCTWFGHSAFKLISPKGKVVLIDPWLNNPKAPPGAEDCASVDMILVTHGHTDHVGNTIEIAKRTHAKVLAVYELSLYFQSQGIADTVALGKGGTVTIDGIRVTLVDARHSGGIETANGVVLPGEPTGFVVRFENGFTLYHAGDTALFGDMQLIGKLYKPDVAMLPIGDLYTMGPRDAAVACELIKPKIIIGMHYGTFPALSGTLQLLKKYLHTKFKSRVMELEPGKEISLL